MAVDKLKPDDPRAPKRTVSVGGRNWSFLDAVPTTQPVRGAVFLVHGFPDFSFAWRYQIPMLLEFGFRCVAIDCMGYGDTGSSDDLNDFTFKTHADAIAGIARHLDIDKFIIGGHDWGGVAVYRVAQWYPSLVTHIFSVCTAFMAPTPIYIPTEKLVATVLPQFGYQLQLGSAAAPLERAVGRDATAMRKFLSGIYGGSPKSGRPFMDPRVGIDLELLQNGAIGMTPLLDEEELAYYTSVFLRHGLGGPCNWYRTRELNFRDDKKLPRDVADTIAQPTLFILATRDNILTREMSRGMERACPRLTRAEVPAAHWALWQTPHEVNSVLKEWLEGVVLKGAESRL